MKEKDYLTLKFGNIKYADLHSKKGKMLFKEYLKTLTGGGLIMQDNNPKQKEIVCKIIDEANVEFIYNDWTGRKMSKERAKRYVVKYGDSKQKSAGDRKMNSDEKQLPCPTCKTPMRNAIDSITKQISPYLWEADCNCEALKGLKLSRG